MTGEVVVRHCAVRVVRRGGWSWGPAPDRLVQRVLDALPGLLDARFADVLAGDTDVEITEPVTVVVPVSLARLRAGSEPFAAREPTVPSGPRTAGPAAVVSPPAATPPVRSTVDGWPDLAALVRSLAERGQLDLLRELLPAPSRDVYGPVLDGSTVDSAVLAAGAVGPTPTRARSTGDVEVRSALPFLVASALSRVDLLDAIGPVLAGAGLLADAPLFATALAYKVLGPLERGWRRPPTDRTDAAAFAGLAVEVPDDALVGFARRAAPALPMLDALVGLSLCRGHEADRPLLLTEAPSRYGGGLLLVEPDGLFPIAWADDAAALQPYRAACGHPPVFGASTDRLDELLTAMGERGAVPLAGGTAFERTVTLFAAVGLGTIAWLLWRHREPTDPHLALSRLGDLGGLVRYEPETVRVRLPLGRRYADLREHGLLADVPDVGWLGGRTLTFGGG